MSGHGYVLIKPESALGFIFGVKDQTEMKIWCITSMCMLKVVTKFIPSPISIHKLVFHFYWSTFDLETLFSSGPPSVPTISCVDLTEDTNGAVNATVNWTLSGRDSADFYLINITTNAPQTPYGGLLNITTGSVTQYELTGFIVGQDYNITVRGVNCGSQEGGESEPLTITPQGMCT